MSARKGGPRPWHESYRQKGSKSYPEGYTRTYSEAYDKIDWTEARQKASEPADVVPCPKCGARATYVDKVPHTAAYDYRCPSCGVVEVPA